MILRNRDLNVQQKETNENQRKKSTQGANAATKRQAARIIKDDKENKKNGSKDEPKPKRACTTIVSPVIPDITKGLYINSTKKVSDQNATQSDKTNELAVVVSPRDEQVLDLNIAVKSPNPVADFDAENIGDMASMSEYAADIFLYYKFREKFFHISDYSKRQPNIDIAMRGSLVDWLIGLQETFELNHETLYLAVKLFDLFMDRSPGVVPRDDIQLAACTAIFIASKFDERAPPLIEDLVYMSEEVFKGEQLMAMERRMLKVVGFDLGAPLSYRFLRRYARIAKEDMGTLTLARYILETALMSLSFCRHSESMIAISALMLAKRMKGAASDWFIMVAQKSSGYKLDKIENLMWKLNKMIVQRKTWFPQMENVYRKYSHEIFFEVAKIPPLAS
jgi:hypothetical protein